MTGAALKLIDFFFFFFSLEDQSILQRSSRQKCVHKVTAETSNLRATFLHPRVSVGSHVSCPQLHTQAPEMFTGIWKSIY